MPTPFDKAQDDIYKEDDNILSASLVYITKTFLINPFEKQIC